MPEKPGGDFYHVRDFMFPIFRYWKVQRIEGGSEIWQ
jgi:hypothetical protein